MRGIHSSAGGVVFRAARSRSILHNLWSLAMPFAAIALRIMPEAD